MNKVILIALVALAASQIVSAGYVDPAESSDEHKEIAALDGFYKLFASFCLKQYSYLKVEFSKIDSIASGPSEDKPYGDFCNHVTSMSTKVAGDFFTTVEQLKQEIPEKVVQDFLRIDVTPQSVQCPSIARVNMLAASCKNQ